MFFKLEKKNPTITKHNLLPKRDYEQEQKTPLYVKLSD